MTSRSRWAASARSRHSAARTFGTSFSAISSRGPAAIGRLTGSGALGVLLLDRLTHGGQPAEHHLLGDRAVLLGERLEQGAAMGLPGSEALGLRPLDRGHGRRLRSGASGRRVPPSRRATAALAAAFASGGRPRDGRRSPSGRPSRRAAIAVARRPPRGPPRSPSRRGPSRRGPSRRGPRSSRDRVARVVVTSGSSLPAGAISSRRSGSLRAPLAGTTAVISMPSTKNSASTFRTSPALAPGGSSAVATVPLGALAPAARQVQVPSSRELVSSMSILRGMRERSRGGRRRTRSRCGPSGVNNRTRAPRGAPNDLDRRWVSGAPSRRAARRALLRRAGGLRWRCRRAMVASRTSRRATRVAIHTRCSSAAAPSYGDLLGRCPVHVGQRALDGADHVGHADLRGRASEPVATIGASLAADDRPTAAARRGCSRGTGRGCPGPWRWPRPSSGARAPSEAACAAASSAPARTA